MLREGRKEGGREGRKEGEREQCTERRKEGGREGEEEEREQCAERRSGERGSSVLRGQKTKWWRGALEHWIEVETWRGFACVCARLGEVTF